MSKYYVYIVETSSGAYYTGITTDPRRRIHEHNHTKKGSKILRGQRPVILSWVSNKSFTRSEALVLERELKRLSHEEKKRMCSKWKKKKWTNYVEK